MEDMISKELLREVLEKKVEIRGFRDRFIPSNFEYLEDVTNVKSINIYELVMHKFKMWALSKGHSLTSWTYKIDSAFCEIGTRKQKDYAFFEGKTEIEAVAKACEWILKESKSCQNCSYCYLTKDDEGEYFACSIHHGEPALTPCKNLHVKENDGV